MQVRSILCVIFTCLLLLTPLHAAPVPGLVAHYNFETLTNGVVQDESGMGNHLRAQGTITLAPGKWGQAVALSPAGYLQAPASPSLELGGEMTLEAWIHPSANPDTGMRILDRQTVGGDDGFMLDTYPNGHLRLITAPGQLRTEEGLPIGVWTHVAATYSETTGEMRLFMNGRIAAESTASGKLRPSAYPLNIGASQGGGDRFQGLMDEVRIYRRALDPAEIEAHFKGKEIPPPASALPNLELFPILSRNDAPRVDYPALCARNDLVYLQPALYPFEAMHLGNGNLGVTLWNEHGMTWQLNNGSYRLGNEPVSSGKVTLSTPALLQTKPLQFEQRTRLWDGIVTTELKGPAGNASLTSFVTEGEDGLVIHCRGSAVGPQRLSLNLWASRTAAHFHTGTNFVALTEHADHPEPFLATNMATLIQVDGAHVTAAQPDDRTLTLTLEGTAPEYTIYVANPLTRGSEADALQAAREMVARLQGKGYAKLLEERKAFWHAFWPRSFLHLSSARGEADFLENLWYLFHYDLASMSRHTLAPKFNGGNWLVHEDERHWGGSYWHQNTREIFWPVYASNHADLSDPFFDLYGRMMEGAWERGKGGFNANGFYFYEVAPLNGGGVPHPPLQPSYSTHLLTVGLEVSLQAWWRYQYTGDETFLRDRLYPLLKGCLDFYLDYARKGPDGYYHLEPANAQETYWAVKDPHQDLAALRWAIPTALQLSAKLGVDESLRGRWQDLLDHLAPYPIDPAKNVFRPADLKPGEESHNSENVEDYGIYPYGQFGLGLPDYERAKNTFLNRPVPGMGNGWEPAPIVAARLGLGDEASRLVLAHMRSNLRSNNGGWYSPTTDVFVDHIPDAPYFDAPGVSAQALEEMALQSQDGIIRAFPAWPEGWKAQCRLRARGGFMVTSEAYAGKARYVLIESEWGDPCTIANPWPEMAVITCGGKELLRSAGPLLKFPTQKGKVYRIERAAEPVRGMKFAALAPASAAGPRSLGSHLPPYPNWTSAAYLGIDAQGHTPQRAVMERNVRDFTARRTAATAGLVDLSTGKAVFSISVGTETHPARTPSGSINNPDSILIPNGEAVVVDLGRPCEIHTLVFSRDPTGLYVDEPAAGYTVETSPDGMVWTQSLDRHTTGANPTGQVDSLPPVTARYLRLRVRGQYNASVRLGRLEVWGRTVTR